MSTSETKGLALSAAAGSQELAADHLDLFLREAERALLLVDMRSDDPGHRRRDGHPSELEWQGAAVSKLSLAIAQLNDAEPHLQLDIDHLAERLRRVGAAAAAADLWRQRALVDLVRLSLELMLNVCPDAEAFEEWIGDEDEHEGWSTVEVYAAYRQLLQVLRNNSLS